MYGCKINFRHSGQESLIQKMEFEERAEEVMEQATRISVGRVFWEEWPARLKAVHEVRMCWCL